jgi:flagellar assembly protein FliH
MSLSHRYHNFSSILPEGELSDLFDQDKVQDAKLQLFEDGYQAGWEDAVKAHEDAKDRIAADFSQNLQDMSFTFHEAFAKLGLAMKPLLTQIVTKVLPELSNKTLAAHVLAQMSDLMSERAEHAIEIAVSPGNLDALTVLLSGKTNIPFEIKAERALGEGQVYLRVNTEEREINLDVVTQGISDALDAFFQQVEQETQDD